MKKLAIVGSTELASEKFFYLIEGIIDAIKPSLVISGGAPGIDSMAAEVSRWNRIPLKEIKPQINQWADKDGLKCYKSRNVEIAEECDILVRIEWDEQEQLKMRGRITNGSKFTMDYTKSLGKKVLNIECTKNAGYKIIKK